MRRRGGAKVHIQREQQLQPGFSYWISRAFDEFLALPSTIAASGLVLAVLFYLLDRSSISFLQPLRSFLQSHIFTEASSTANFVSTVTGGLMTVTSITISILVVALQQSVSNMSERVFGQFIRRRINQVYFGVFVGAVLYSLLTLATIHTNQNAIFAASVDLILAAISIYMLIILLYTTMNQMNPEVIIGAIHDQTLRARKQQMPLIQNTLREATYDGPNDLSVRAISEGYITRINLDVITRAIQQGKGRVEVHLLVSVGCYVIYEDQIADIEAEYAEDAEQVGQSVRRSLDLSRQRDILNDAAFGLEQLETIGWTAISSAKSDPAPGLMVIRSAGDLLSHWVRDQSLAENQEKKPKETLNVVYHDDFLDRLIDVLESAQVAAHELQQHMSLAEVYVTLMNTFIRLNPSLQRRIVDLLLRGLPALESLVLTRTLEQALGQVVRTLRQTGYQDAAGAIQKVWDRKAGNIRSIDQKA